ncbi:MAG: hypothetical protein COA79_20640 [Planctomycetota bacterium]|nr:MAG: hypothetical protein COA79_20640 [Planctomycetota bacterium]
MGIMNYSYNEFLNVVVLKPAGKVQVSDICAYGSELLDQGIMTKDTIEYVDMSSMTDLSVSYIEARRLVSMHKLWLSAGWYGSVYFTSTDLEFGIVRMVGAVVECIPDSPTGIMIPLREPTPLEQLREVISNHISNPLN